MNHKSKLKASGFETDFAAARPGQMYGWKYLLPASDTFVGVVPLAEAEEIDGNEDISILDKLEIQTIGEIEANLSAEREPMPGNRPQNNLNAKLCNRVRYTRVLPLKVEFKCQKPGCLDLRLRHKYVLRKENLAQVWLFAAKGLGKTAGRFSLLLKKSEAKLADDCRHFRWKLCEAILNPDCLGQQVMGLRLEIKKPGSAVFFLDALRLGTYRGVKPKVEPLTRLGSLKAAPCRVKQESKEVKIIWSPGKELKKGFTFRLVMPALWRMQDADPDKAFYVKTFIRKGNIEKETACNIRAVDFVRWAVCVNLNENLSPHDGLIWHISNPVWTEEKISGEKCFRLYIKYPGGKKEFLYAKRPVLYVEPGSSKTIKAYLSAPAAPNKPFRLKIVSNDAKGNRSPSEDRRFISKITRDNKIIREIKTITLDRGYYETDIPVKGGGLYKAVVKDKTGIKAHSNLLPLEPDADLYPYFGYLHTHSDMSNDGRESTDYCYKEGLLNAGLDFCSVTDHFWSDSPSWQWEHILECARKYNRDGKFVTFPGYEWSSQDHGDRNIYFKDTGPQCPLGFIESTPRELYLQLEGYDALVIPHSTAYDVRTDGICWDAHNPEFERLVEVFSNHGSSEMVKNNPYPLRSAPMLPAVENNTVQAALARGIKVGFIAGGDNHRRPLPEDPAMGLTGIAGVWAKELTRDGIWEALQARRCFATTGTRATVKLMLNDCWMGETVCVKPTTTCHLDLAITSLIPIKKVELLRNNLAVKTWQFHGNGNFVFKREWKDKDDSLSAKYYYLRAFLDKGQMAWSSPVWFESSTSIKTRRWYE